MAEEARSSAGLDRTMIAALTLCAFAAVLLLTLVTVVQMLYMDSLRLRTKEYPMLQVFRDELDERIGLKAEAGVLTFSLIKHSLLALLGTLTLLLAAIGEPVSILPFVEAAAAAWATMMLFAYMLPQYLYRGTSGQWLTAFVPLLRLLVFIIKPLTALLGFLQSLSELSDKDQAKQEAGTQEG